MPLLSILLLCTLIVICTLECDYNIQYGNRAFTYYPDRLNQTESRQACKNDEDGDLAIVNNAELTELCGYYYHWRIMYIGLEDIYDLNNGSDFVWVDESIPTVYTNWFNEFYVPYDCVIQFHYTASLFHCTWFTVPCYLNFPRLCEKCNMIKADSLCVFKDSI